MTKMQVFHFAIVITKVHPVALDLFVIIIDWFLTTRHIVKMISSK